MMASKVFKHFYVDTRKSFKDKWPKKLSSRKIIRENKKMSWSIIHIICFIFAQEFVGFWVGPNLPSVLYTQLVFRNEKLIEIFILIKNGFEIV